MSTISVGHTPQNLITGVPTFSTTAGITASSTQTQGQQPLTAGINEVSTCAVANNAVTLPPAVAGRMVAIANNGAQTLQVFPASGDSIDDGSADASKSQASGVNVIYFSHNDTVWNRVHSPL